VFLAMKIAYANELARLCEAFGANASLVADGMGLDDRIGRAFLDAGPGIGGSCLPEQAVALASIAKGAGVAAPLIRSVSQSNDVHRAEIVRRLEELLPTGLRGARVAVLGLAFKANTDDVRQSPALAIVELLRESGAIVVGTDPRAAATARRADPSLVVAQSVPDAVSGADAVLITTEWQEYRSLDWRALAARMRGSIVFDTRAIVDPVTVTAAGLQLERLGRPRKAPATAEVAASRLR
jgi:UDPglucose 6-dehydrogenase